MEVLSSFKEGNITSMKNMVDMALANEIGVVNFNILHSLLHAILSKLEIEEINVEIMNEKSDIDNLNSKGMTLPLFQYNGLRERVINLETQVNSFNLLPSNKDIVNILTNPNDNEQSEIINQQSVKSLWQTINMKNQLASNEEGIEKLAGLVDSVFDEIKQLKSDNDELRKKLENVTISKDAADKIDKLQNDFESLLTEFETIKERLSKYPSSDAMRNIVSWEKLENALKGIRSEMEELKTQNQNSNTTMEPMGDLWDQTIGGPSEECSVMLEKLGNLTVDYELLDQRVVNLEKEMPNKIDKEELKNLTEEILENIKKLEDQMTSLKEFDDFSKIRKTVIDMQDKMNIFNETIDKFSSDNKNLLFQIEEIFGVIKDHEHRKADIEYIDELLKTKSDVSLLDSKLNSSLFDETTEGLKTSINDLLKKLLLTEEDLKNLLKLLSQDVNAKVDKNDLNALKESFEKRIRKLTESLKNIRGRGGFSDDDAAGLRKQLLQHFHCISCDRPVDIFSHGLNYTYPDQKGLPTTKSLKPYITYDLDGIRQQMKSSHDHQIGNPKYFSYGADIIDVYQTSRPCGGVIYPSKKTVKPGSVNNSFPEEDTRPKSVKDELELQGIDGHIYKGRLDRSQTTLINNSHLVDQLKNEKFPPVTLTQIRNQTLASRSAFVTARPKSSVRMPSRQSNIGGNMRASSARVKLQETYSRQSSPVQTDEQNKDHNIGDQKQNIFSSGGVEVISDNFKFEIGKSTEDKDQSVEETVLL